MDQTKGQIVSHRGNGTDRFLAVDYLLASGWQGTIEPQFLELSGDIAATTVDSGNQLLTQITAFGEVHRHIHQARHLLRNSPFVNINAKYGINCFNSETLVLIGWNNRQRRSVTNH